MESRRRASTRATATCANWCTRSDDRLVIMGSGDELRLRVRRRGLPPLAGRLARDFLLLVDGWAKDADANTAFSQTVEPLPFHAMSRYPYPAVRTLSGRRLAPRSTAASTTRARRCASSGRSLHRPGAGSTLPNLNIRHRPRCTSWTVVCLSVEEKIPWKCRQLVIGTGTGELPVMKEVKREAARRKIKLLTLPTSEAMKVLKEDSAKTNAVLHITC